MPTLVDVSSMNERKKRTRPVSACENCRSKKVKCHLLPDRPVCKGCAQSGKECLFRIDDLSPALRRERFAEYGLPEDDEDNVHQPARRRRKRSSLLPVADGAAAEEEGGQTDATGKSKPIFRSFANPTKLVAPSSAAAPASAQNERESSGLSKDSDPDRSSSGPLATQYDYDGIHSGHPPPSNYHAHPAARSGYTHATASGPAYVGHNLNSQQASYEARPHTDMYNPAMATYPSAHTFWSRSPNEQGGSASARPNPAALSPNRNYYQREAQMNSSYPAIVPTQSRQPPFAHAAPVEQYSQPPVHSRDYAAARPSTHTWPPTGTSWSPRTASAMGQTSTQAPPVPAYNVPQPVRADENHERHSHRQHDSLQRSSYSAQRHTSFGSSSGSTRPVDLSAKGSDGASVRMALTGSSQNDEQSLELGMTRNDLAAASKLEEERDTAEEKAKSVSFLRKAGSKSSQNGQSATVGSVSEHTVSPRSTSTTSKPPATFKKIALPFFRWFGATANTPGIRRIKVGVYHDQELDLAADEGQTPAGGSIAQLSGADIGTPSVYGAAQSSPTNERNSELKRGKSSSPLKTPFSPPNFASPGMIGPSTVPSHVHGAESVLSTTARELFESSRPRYPRNDILLHLSSIFVKYFKASCFPWLDEAELMSSAESGELPAILANAICAVAARFSSHPDLQRAKNSSEAFADMAKVLIVPMLSWPSIEVIEALIILSYAEFGAGADAGLWMYIGMALRMATDLGLQHELTIKSMATKKHQERARSMFWAIVCLDRITCFGTGRPLTIRDDTYDCQLPPLEEDATADGFLFGYIVRTLLKRGRIGELLNRREDDAAFEQRGAQLRALWLDLANYYETLPADLHFGVNTFRKLAAADKGSAFVYLHVLLQSTISLLNRPSLLRRFDKDFMVTAPSSLAGIANHASGTIVSILRFAMDAGNHRGRTNEDEVNPYIDCNPYLDQLILPAGRSFLSERESAKETLRSFGHQGPLSRPVTRDGKEAGSGAGVKPFSAAPQGANEELFKGLNTRRQYAQTNIETCQEVLDRIARRWIGAQWPARALRQEAEGAVADDVGPDGPDEEAQPAPIRDVEMVLRWARARRIRARRTTPPDSRRHSDASADTAVNGQVQGDTAGGTAGGAGGAHADSAGAYDLSSLWHDADGTSGSPLGLGFSGSLGAASEIDVDALINAWARELGTIESTSAVHHPDFGTPASSGLGLRGHSSYEGGHAATRGEMTPGALISRSRPASRAVNRRAPSTPGVSDLFGGAGLSATTPGGGQHHHQSTSIYDLQGWPGSAQNGMNIDLSAMQMEEFFFETTPSISGTATAMHEPHAGHHMVNVNSGGGPTSAAAGYGHETGAAVHQHRGISAFATPKEEAYIDLTNDVGKILQQDLDIIPAALLNTLNIHPKQAHLYTPQQQHPPAQPS